MDYIQVQNIAKQTMDFIRTIVKPGMKVAHIRKLCEDKMIELGADSFWYWDVGALCFSGEDTAISVSGKDYNTPAKSIQENDVITIDLSPQCVDIWGDLARTIIVENGVVIENLNDIINSEWKTGLIMEDKLHQEMREFVARDTTFEQLFFHINKYIIQCGYTNLDFMGNLGHSIVKTKSDRVYIEKGNNLKLSEVDMFTFEPHIGIANSKYGYKKENIYFFDGEKVKEL